MVEHRQRVDLWIAHAVLRLVDNQGVIAPRHSKGSIAVHFWPLESSAASLKFGVDSVPTLSSIDTLSSMSTTSRLRGSKFCRHASRILRQRSAPNAVSSSSSSKSF